MKSDFKRGEGFNVIYAGELIHWKGAAYAVDAFVEFARHRSDARLIVIGSGPLREQLERKVAKSDLLGHVNFLGKVPMEDLIEELARGDIFLYPSYHHGLATVVLQAMLTGLPIICLEGDAIGRAVGSECGITVVASKSENFINALSEGLTRLYEDEPLRRRFAKRSQELAEMTYPYASIGRGYDNIYQEILNTICCGES